MWFFNSPKSSLAKDRSATWSNWKASAPSSSPMLSLPGWDTRRASKRRSGPPV